MPQTFLIKKLLQGDLFVVQFQTPVLAEGEKHYVGISTNGTPVVYLDRVYDSPAQEVTVRLFKHPFTGGVELVTKNRNLSSGELTPAGHFDSPSFTGELTDLETSIPVRAQSADVRAGSQIITSGEWYVLDAHTQYILEIECVDAMLPSYVYFRWTLGRV